MATLAERMSRKAGKAAKTKILAEEAKRKEEARREKLALKRIVSEGYREILSEIKKQSDEGHKSLLHTVYRCDEGGKRHLGWQIQEQLTKKLTTKRNGLKVESDYRHDPPSPGSYAEGYTDAHFYSLKISWGKQDAK